MILLNFSISLLLLVSCNSKCNLCQGLWGVSACYMGRGQYLAAPAGLLLHDELQQQDTTEGAVIMQKLHRVLGSRNVHPGQVRGSCFACTGR